MGQKIRRKKRSATKFRKMKKVVASAEKEADSSEDEKERRGSKEDESSDSSSSHIDEGMSADKVEEEIVNERENQYDDTANIAENQISEGAKIVTKYCEKVTNHEVDDTEEDVRVEMMESAGEVIEDTNYFQNEMELKNLQELEDMIQKYLISETEPLPKKFVQEVERVYTYRSSDEPVVEELIEPQIAYPLEAVCKGMFNDANDKKSDSGSSSSDSDSSEGGASNKPRKKKKSKSSDDEDAKESENSDSEDEFEEAVEKHGKSDSEHEVEGPSNNEEIVEKHITTVESEKGTGEEHIEEHVTVSKQLVDGSTEVITERHVTVVKTEVVGDIDPEKKESILQEVREKFEKEREDNSSDSERSKKKEEGKPGSSDSGSDAEEKEQPSQKVIKQQVTSSRKETFTEERVTVVKTEIIGDLDPEEKERIIQEMKDKLAEEGDKLSEQKIPQSHEETEEMKQGSSDSESDSEPREIHDEKRSIQEVLEEREEVTDKKGSDSESEGEEVEKKQIKENKSSSSGSDSDDNAEKEERGEETIEGYVTVTKHETSVGTEVVSEKHVITETTETIRDVDPEDKEKINLEMKSTLEKEEIAGQKGSDSESGKEDRGGRSGLI